MRTRSLAGLLILVVLGGAALFAFTFHHLLFTPYQKIQNAGIVEIPAGTSVKKSAELLFEKGWIPTVPGFVLLARLTGSRGHIRAGEYQLTSSMSPWEILQHLRDGDVVLHRITIPEGLRDSEIAAIVAKALPLSRDRFIALLTDPEFIHSLGLDVPTLEGYLMPETYAFPLSATEEEVIQKMVREMFAFLNEGRRKRAESLGMSLHEILTLASIIEKEMGVQSEGPIISSVYHRRLKLNMRLQSDPTVIYGIDDFDGDLRWKDLKQDSPYNTYLRTGLPPTPIASPGKTSIEAALYPADTRYLYFVSKNDRTHLFSETLAEHNRAVDKYQKGLR